jgi:hypothetical protein
MTVTHELRRPHWLATFAICLAAGCSPASVAPSAAPPTAGGAEHAQQSRASEPLPTTPPEAVIHPEYARALAQAAYVWGYPMVNMLNRRALLSQAPTPGRLNGVIPVAPVGQLSMLSDYIDPGQSFIACPNQDVVYGLAYFDLDTQPVIVQVPDFGDRFWVYAIYDARTDQVGELGKPYGTKPGFYALVGPSWKGQIPDGVNGVIRSPTALGNVIPRIFMDDTAADREAIQPLINQVGVYPFERYTGQIQTTVWRDTPSIPRPGPAEGGGAETKWVKPGVFFDQLPTILETVAPLPGEEALYEQFRMLVAVGKKNAEIKAAMADAAKQLDDTLIKDFLQWKYNGVPAGNGWNRSLHNAEWGRDYFNRTGTSRSNMFDNRPSETQYFYTDFTSDGQKLTGAGTYSVTFAKDELPPVDGFWSLTLYNEQHFFHPNELRRYSLGTKNKSLKYNPDGSLTLYAGHRSPGADKESNWLPAPEGPFSLYIRAYWGKQPIIDGSWVPPRVSH